ncbi:MAG: hypothetical protein AAGE59_25165 [Cyanobacteria bacterium P01_F01_bin.86]
MLAPILAIARITFSPIRTPSAADVVQRPAQTPVWHPGTCAESTDAIPLKAHMQQIWERVNKAPRLELHHREMTHGERYEAIEQYVRPDQFRRVIYSERYPGSSSPIAGIESVYVGDRAYERLGSQAERWFAAPRFGNYTSNTHYGQVSGNVTVSALRFTGKEILETGIEACLYAYQRTTTDEQGMTIETSSEVLWVSIDDGHPQQWRLEKVNHHLTPPIITERTTTFHYPDTLTIQIPIASLVTP